jgi:16S rRNA (adenine1518-N6/adenine1519-N6)-dimethyltransferase
MAKHGKVRAKKSLGQHFLKDEDIAKKITDALQLSSNNAVLEIGPGMGVLTKYLLQNTACHLKVIEIDRDSVTYLKQHFAALAGNIIEGDFLEMNLAKIFETQFSIIGNFPYNISSQIFFKVLEERNRVTEVVCMLQKEVADRMAAKHGNKTYGILSVLLQTYYDIEFLFSVPPTVFIPPPKVMSGVIRLTRNKRTALTCDEVLFMKVVKTGFNQRRKTLRNALKNLTLANDVVALPILNMRAEQLSVDDFINLTQVIEKSRAGVHGV